MLPAHADGTLACVSGPIEIALPSVQSLFVTAMVGETALGTGTAFVVEHAGQAWLVTNWHVAAGRNPITGEARHPSLATPDRLRVLHNGESLGQWTAVDYALFAADDQPVWREHPAYGRRVDAVAIRLNEQPGVRFYPYSFTIDPMFRLSAVVSDDVSIIGFPFGLTGGGGVALWSRGAIASEPDLDYNDLPSFLIDSRTRPGQSGSPVIVYSSGAGGHRLHGGSLTVGGGPKTRFLGVYSGRINEQSDLGFVWKASAIQDIVERGVVGDGGLVPRPRTN